MARVKKQRVVYSIPLRVDEKLKRKRKSQAMVARDFLRMGYHPVEVARMMTQQDPEGRVWTKFDVEDYIDTYL